MQETQELRGDGARLKLVEQLEAGLRDHVGWLLQVNRVFICQEAVREADIHADAHLHCALGNWLHCDLQGWQEMDAACQPIAALHRELHACVRDSLIRRSSGQKLDAAAYDAISECAMRFSDGVRSVQRKISAGMYRHEPPKLSDTAPASRLAQ